MKRYKSLRIQIGGYCRPRTGETGYGIVFSIPGSPHVVELSQRAEAGSYHLAVYDGLIQALYTARELREDLGCPLALFIESDCELLVMQMRGAWEVNDYKLRRYHELANSFRDQFGVCRITHVSARPNAHARRLATEVLAELDKAA